MEIRHHDYRLAVACIAASLVVHAGLLTLLSGWNTTRDGLPPLMVELAQPKPALEIEPPRPLSVQPRRETRQPEPPQPVSQPRTPQAAVEEKTRSAPMLTAPAETAAPSAPAIATETRAPADVTRTQPETAAAVPALPRVGPSYLHNPEPPYPLVAFRRGETGTVHLLVRVTAEGRAASVTLNKSSGSSALDEAAARAVRDWRFSPARQGTQAVDGEVIVPVVFKLN